MIALKIAVGPLPVDHDLVFRLRSDAILDQRSKVGRDAILISHENGTAEYDASGLSLRLKISDPEELNGDVILVRRGARTAHRLIRQHSRHNTLLVTEQCDQKCIMCSQPPKLQHLDLFESFGQALELAPENSRIGITGGEPTLHKKALFGLLANARKKRPDLTFHVLTNAQHFEEDDIASIEALGSDAVLWGIPLYSADALTHDKIVEKNGAFARLGQSLSYLARAGARIELRTVLLKANSEGLDELADFVSRKLSFIDFWAIMQLENIGYARKNWSDIFFDTSLDFEPLATAIDLASGRGLNLVLYNFPLCTVPVAYRHFCTNSISDWKNKHLPFCEGCSAISSCAGFFEWAPATGGFARLEQQ